MPVHEALGSLTFQIAFDLRLSATFAKEQVGGEAGENKAKADQAVSWLRVKRIRKQEKGAD